MKELILKQRKYAFFSVLTAVLLFASCESMTMESNDEKEAEKQTVTVSVMQVENTPWNATRAAGDLCTRLSLAFFDGTTGEKVMQVDQVKADEDFGTFVVELARKTYHMVLIGYTADKAASMNAYNDVKFDGNKITEVFSCYKSFKVDSENTSLPVTLNRVSAMLGLEITGDIPDNVNRVLLRMVKPSRFLNPSTGLGNPYFKPINVEKFIEEGVNFYSTNIFAMAEPQVLDTVEISALVASGDTIKHLVFIKQVEIAPNTKTIIKGDLFGKSSNMTVEIDDTWNDDKVYDIP